MGPVPTGHGLGSLRTFAADLVVPDPDRCPCMPPLPPGLKKDNTYYFSLLLQRGAGLWL